MHVQTTPSAYGTNSSAVIALDISKFRSVIHRQLSKTRAFINRDNNTMEQRFKLQIRGKNVILLSNHDLRRAVHPNVVTVLVVSPILEFVGSSPSNFGTPSYQLLTTEAPEQILKTASNFINELNSIKKAT